MTQTKPKIYDAQIEGTVFYGEKRQWKIIGTLVRLKGLSYTVLQPMDFFLIFFMIVCYFY